jgi:putative thioredoxin
MDFGARKPAAGANQAGASAALVKDATTQTFAKDVIEASKQGLVLVDFWADWCGPCKQLTPIIEKVVKTYKGKVRLVKVNVDQNTQIASQLRVQSLPTVYAFRDGRPVDGFMGAQPESAVKAFVDRLLGDDAGGAEIAEALKAGEQALETGDLQNAAEVFAAVLQEEPQNVQAIAGLARCYLKSGDIERAEQTLSLAPPEKAGSAAISSVKAAIALAQKADQAGSTSELVAKVKAAPNDHQLRLDLAMAHAARGEKAEAIEQLLELFRRDRKWNDEAARKQMVQLFEAWGPKDPMTVEGRRRLSSLMFV